MFEKLFNVKKRFFKRELAQTQARVWGYEFSRYTTLFEREKNRQMYDRVTDNLQRELAKKEKDTKTIEELEAQQKAIKQSLDDLDVMIDGSEPNGKYPEGVQGITQSLEAQVQKREHIKNFIKHYC